MSKPKANSVTITVSTTINQPIKKVFEYVVPIDLSHIFKRYKFLPAVSSTSNKKKWYTPGMQRTVCFEDGTQAQEYLLSVNPHTDFSYKIDSFTSSLKYLAKQIDGQWKFSQNSKNSTQIEWTYTINSHNKFTQLIIRLSIQSTVQTLLNNALHIIQEDLQKM